jgi:hypothetical protein
MKSDSLRSFQKYTPLQDVAGRSNPQLMSSLFFLQRGNLTFGSKTPDKALVRGRGGT